MTPLYDSFAALSHAATAGLQIHPGFARWVTGKGSGKSGGLRVLYYFDGEQLVLLVTLFKKTDQENIDAGEKAMLRKLINELQR